ncbi:putative sulfite oxidase [Aspergillus ruber CBS 135680]|uniref:Sulfite oxidase n=1 Tax=Aspergillus ruber (strain CBS 135680) TaxID=1388766 RepID=A0A017SFP0_ASPRC|nr:sulfite oxidase [Aspergillus ruber CBS 135680]EYE95536.1 sulfite oxidase [Aspergillus ruber CBS 135680]
MMDGPNQVEYSVEKPLNREPPTKNLVDRYHPSSALPGLATNLLTRFSFYTPQDISYDRNHGPIPHLPTGEDHLVRIDGQVRTPVTLSVKQLATEFPQYQIICALECAGNRRHTMRTLLREVEGIDWGDGAVMNCKWKGPKLRDVLRSAGGITGRIENLHAAFSCYQVRTQNDTWYGGSVPLERIMKDEDGGDVILALEMNDMPLMPKHGYPLRAVLPGIAGARWVKWLDKITIQDHESTNFYQKRDYKVLPEEAVDKESAEPHWDRTPPMYDTPINSVIGVPTDEETVTLRDGKVEVKGYAVPNAADGPVTRVQVSTDRGKNWVDAEIGKSEGQRNKWCWVLWRAEVDIEPGTGKEIWSRAFDAGGNVQKEHSQWNLRGVGYNGYGRAMNITIA